MATQHETCRQYPRQKSVRVHGQFNAFRGFGVADDHAGTKYLGPALRDPFDMSGSSFFCLNGSDADRKDRSRLPTASSRESFVTEKPNFLNHFPRKVTAGNDKGTNEARFIEIGTMDAPGGAPTRIAATPGFGVAPAGLDHRDASTRDDAEYGDRRAIFEEKFSLEVAVHDHVRDLPPRWARPDQRSSTIRDDGTEHCPKH